MKDEPSTIIKTFVIRKPVGNGTFYLSRVSTSFLWLGTEQKTKSAVCSSTSNIYNEVAKPECHVTENHCFQNNTDDLSSKTGNLISECNNYVPFLNIDKQTIVPRNAIYVNALAGQYPDCYTASGTTLTTKQRPPRNLKSKIRSEEKLL